MPGRRYRLVRDAEQLVRGQVGATESGDDVPGRGDRHASDVDQRPDQPQPLHVAARSSRPGWRLGPRPDQGGPRAGST